MALVFSEGIIVARESAVDPRRGSVAVGGGEGHEAHGSVARNVGRGCDRRGGCCESDREARGTLARRLVALERLGSR